MRFFEAMSCGTMLLTDYLPAQKDIATDGIHYVSYKDWPDLDRKIEFYLEHENLRKAIAKCGRFIIEIKNTYEHRLRKILEDFLWKF
jgi:spore maturation protein CgeB